MHHLKHARRGNGSVHVAVDLACAQASDGYAVSFVAGEGSYDEVLRRHGVDVFSIPEASGLRGAWRAFIATAGVARRVRPDIVHAHMMSSTVIGWVVALIARATLVTTMHNSFDAHSRLMRIARITVAVSRAERDLLVERGFPAHRVRTVLNGVVGSAREEIAVDEIGDIARPSLVTLSGLHGRKGIDDVIRAFALVAQDFPQWHVNVIGWGPAREDLEALATALGLADRAHFCGPTLTPWRQLSQAQIFVTGARAEPFGLNIIEARAAGCAVVATEVGGIPEALDGGSAGMLVPPADPVAMAAAMRSLMGDPALLETWRRRARQGIDYFSVSRMARDYTDVYREAIPARRRPPVEPTSPTPQGAVARRRGMEPGRSVHQH
ncbi:glycosyltransferase [Demequina sp. NBRC 110055]|uniref:glycosyltransferase n=1 Tax=Demequina sp. NBRC 110055 TaxID=1570344 RepID=UPI0013564434|nr:glycosyltransferase [Demequina sp. NBRC 110055]